MTSRVDAGLLTICVTGPESTGKTTLARRLGEQLSVEWVPEASRLYAERIGRDLSVIDVEPIAREHIALADAARARAIGVGASVLVLDTDLASTVVYGKHYYDVAVPCRGSQTASAMRRRIGMRCSRRSAKHCDV